jgi:hypothetical protein
MSATHLLLTLLLAFTGDADQLQETKLDEIKLKVLLPGKPELVTQKLPNNVSLKTYLSRGSNALYVVASMDLPETANEADDKLQERLDTARDLAVQNARGKLLKETRIKLAGKQPGREITIELPAGQGVARQRFYLAEGRLVQLIIVGSQEAVGSASADRFFGSLVLMK